MGLVGLALMCQMGFLLTRATSRVATGLDYTEAAPVSGTRFGDTRESLSVQVQVQQ